MLVAVPVAGFSAIVVQGVERAGDLGDIEQTTTDLLNGSTTRTLAAHAAPRPTLLIYNAEDDCCFRAALVKPYIYDQMRARSSELYGKEDASPGTRTAIRQPTTTSSTIASRPIASSAAEPGHFRDRPRDPGGRPEVQSYDELAVGLPTDNLTLLTLSRRLAAGIHREPAGRPNSPPRCATGPCAWSTPGRWRIPRAMASRRSREQLQFDNPLGATAVWVRAIGAAERRPDYDRAGRRRQAGGCPHGFRSRQSRWAGGGA